MKLSEFVRGMEAIVIGKTVGCSLEEAGINIGQVVVMKAKKQTRNKSIVIMAR